MAMRNTPQPEIAWTVWSPKKLDWNKKATNRLQLVIAWNFVQPTASSYQPELSTKTESGPTPTKPTPPRFICALRVPEPKLTDTWISMGYPPVGCGLGLSNKESFLLDRINLFDFFKYIWRIEKNSIYLHEVINKVSNMSNLNRVKVALVEKQ